MNFADFPCCGSRWTTRVINIGEEALAVGAGGLWEVAPVAAKGDAPGPGDHC